ncbi:MAG TPA: YggS family pyridoxal phosphate-dependent enzyme [Planctomycetaceae bacterium]|jgi:pyridoxal phosphate enzyme (YggS family)|nr:YggS family pyridoxal phosphate-dependent enzyme [Planctomycetaceae bacterium]
MRSVESLIAANYAQVSGQIAEACRRAGRLASGVRLVAVTKSAEIAWIEALLAIGIRDLAESRPQQLGERALLLDKSVCWHLVGHLQRNKVRKVLPAASWIHSVDTLPLLRRIDDVAGELGLRPRLLLEVNVSGETGKNGFRPNELVAAWPAVAAVSNVDIAGLMTMAPWTESPEAARPVFSGLRALRDQLTASSSTVELPELSMGMSGDFEVAIEEGATLVRIGTSLFEGLEPHDD